MEKVISIIENSQAAYLATVDSQGRPEIRALLNLPNPKKYKKLAGKALQQEGETLTMYYPKGKTDPDYTILKFTSTKLEGWYDLGRHVFGGEA